jgi:tripartite-type tricarboxylate transporter receptor subunit TctC
MNTRRQLLAGIATLPLWSGSALAQRYPARPLRVLVGFAAGGITDTTARVLVEVMSPVLGQPMIVDNKPGAGGNIATSELARSVPDGYTLMVASPGQLVVNPMTQASPGFDPKLQFSLIGLTNTSPFVVVVPANSPFRSVAELVAWGRSHPGELLFASPGIGTTMHIGGEMLNAFTGVGAVHVPYRGGAQSSADLIAGRVHFMIDSLGATSSMINGGQLRVIGVTGSRRMERFPDAAALVETWSEFELSSWLGLVGPPRLPAEVTKTLAAALAQAVRVPRFAEHIASRGSATADPSPGAFAAHLERERRRIERTIVKTGLKLD